jgi:hypothetical protein
VAQNDEADAPKACCISENPRGAREQDSYSKHYKSLQLNGIEDQLRRSNIVRGIALFVNESWRNTAARIIRFVEPDQADASSPVLPAKIFPFAPDPNQV